jgi:Dual specificity phosphatase, catalytic domain
MLNARVAFRYAVAAASTALGAWWLGGWGWLLLWLAISLAAQALAYAGWGVAVFRKAKGRLPWSVRILLAPYMICARITLHYYCRGLAPWAQVTPGVWLGRRLTGDQAKEAISKGLTAVLDLTAGFPESGPLLSLSYCNIQLLPITVPDLDQLHTAVHFLEKESRDGIVLVHGALGYSRSVGVVAAYLLATGTANRVEDAVARVRAVAPQTLLDDTWMKRLHEFAAELPEFSARPA